VTGTNKIHYEGADIQTSRNMVIIRHGSELSLINSVRLNDEGLKQLDQLGTVTHIIRIGAFHGRDDAFYKSYYPKSTLWTLPGATYENGLAPDKVLTPEGDKLSQGVRFSCLKHPIPGRYLHIDRDGGILISCDSIQTSLPRMSFTARNRSIVSRAWPNKVRQYLPHLAGRNTDDYF